MKIVRDSAVRQEPAQPQAVSPEENRFSIRPRQIALFFLWMLAFTLLARGTSGALLPEVQLSTPAPNTITQSLTATGTIQWAAGSLFYLPEGLLVEAVFVSEGEAVQEGDKIAALRREDVEQKLRSLQAELAQKQTEYARLTKPVAADSYDLEKAQQALQAAYQAAENSAAAWEEKEANAGSERDALQRELNERQEKAAQYAREIAEKQAQRKLLQQEESPDEEIISRIEAELTQLTAEETQNREALAEAEARLNEADAALESVQSQREEAARTAAQAAEQAEQARNDARHAYEKSVEAASETAAANAASATVLAEQIREMESSVETLKKLDEQEGVFCAPQTGTVETVVLLSHKKPDSVINVKVEFGEGEGKIPLDNIEKRAESYKPKERVTYKMIKEYIEAKHGFKVHTAYIAEVKRDLGLPMYDAPNAVEELKQPRKHPTPEKVEAIKDALKHFEVI